MSGFRPDVWGPSQGGAVAQLSYRGAGQSIPQGAWTTVSWDTLDYDPGGLWSAGDPTKLTMRAPGTLVAIVSSRFDGTGAHGPRILKNGAAVPVCLNSVRTTLKHVVSWCLVSVVSADVLTAQVFQDSGIPANFVPGSSAEEVPVFAVFSLA